MNGISLGAIVYLLRLLNRRLEDYVSLQKVDSQALCWPEGGKSSKDCCLLSPCLMFTQMGSKLFNTKYTLCWNKHGFAGTSTNKSFSQLNNLHSLRKSSIIFPWFHAR